MQQSIMNRPDDRLMLDFASRTGLDPPSDDPRRYLWTDAFAACNYLGRYREDGHQTDLDLARRLIDQVHHVLGKYRPGSTRAGWISGLDEDEGEKHPTVGGLRIGKPREERPLDQPYDQMMEWERDGQYYHYLTKWMHALSQAGRITEDASYIEQGVELARTVHRAFVRLPGRGGRKEIYWKMRVDLSRPLVSSMGQHDPLDGYLTYVELQVAGQALRPGSRKELVAEISELAMMARGGSWETDDPLGVGGLLIDASRMAQLMKEDALTDAGLLGQILRAALPGLMAISTNGSLDLPAEQRLAFRELGLSIGLKGVSIMRESLIARADLYGNNTNMRLVQELMRFLPLAEKMESFWSRPESQATPLWEEHRDINTVMLATSMGPQGFLRF